MCLLNITRGITLSEALRRNSTPFSGSPAFNYSIFSALQLAVNTRPNVSIQCDLLTEALFFNISRWLEKNVHRSGDDIVSTRFDKCLQPVDAPKNRTVKYESPWRWRRRTPKHVGKCNVIYTVGGLTLRLLRSYIYMEHLFLMFLDHT